MSEDGVLDEPGLRSVINRVIEAGVHGVTPLGSTGELPFLSDEVREQVIRVTVEEVAGRVPVVAGVGGFTTRGTLQQVRSAERAGVDGLLVVLQAYYPLREDEILAFFTDVAAATPLPIVLYQHAKPCHVALSAPLVERLALIPNVSYVKESSGTLDLFSRSARLAELGMRLFAATSVSPTVSMLLGAVGWMSGPACVMPAESVLIHRLCTEGRHAEALELEQAMSPILGVFRTLGPAAATKALLRADGLDVGAPMAPIRAEHEGVAEALESARSAVSGVLERLESEPA
jgi:4-hydroxy-tetrahydrodipicolinate synthase